MLPAAVVLVSLALAAVALCLKSSEPPVADKFSVRPELFMMPAPLMVNVKPFPVVIVKALAPELKTMPLTSVLAESEMLVMLEEAKVAVSDAPLGTVAGDQLLAVFQSPVAGLDFQVALPVGCRKAFRTDSWVLSEALS